MYTSGKQLQHRMDCGSSPSSQESDPCLPLGSPNIWAFSSPPTALPPLVISFHVPLLPLEGAVQEEETAVPRHISAFRAHTP